MPKKPERAELGQSWRATPEDRKLLQELASKLGVKQTDIIRMGIRKLAQAEGLR
jgi:hypothetical protein